ncbi:MAG: glycerol-3-phosphate dehydrogenase/oxidase [Pseudomonadota bacterium]|nr:glycerol-3-phosphate dehydrogenase/oxidase [Pseudomonadota bacterium]
MYYDNPYDRGVVWERLGHEVFDLVIIGGGAIGAGAARDAALRGLKVALVEADDTASGTSSRSSKLIHGGLRYLEQGDLALVFESVSERRTMMQIAPHLVRPLGFLFPIYASDPVRLATLRLGLIVYEGLALFRSPKRHKTLSAAEVAEEVPLLRRAGLHGGPLYWDCMTDDARLTLETVLDARQAGAAVLTYGRVTELLRGEGRRIQGVKVADVLDRSGTPRTVEIRASAVINATGPWSDRIRSSGDQVSHQLRLTKGVHIVVPAARIPLQHTVVCFHPKDQRVLFCIPWGDQVYIGTTDTDYEGDPRDVAADAADIAYLLQAVDAYFPEVHLRPDEITATWAGLRPLIRAEGVAPSQVSREHVITTDPDGLISIAGGKLTTARRMGAEVVDEAVEWMKKSGNPPATSRSVNTGQLPLPGAVGWPADDDGTEVAQKVLEAAGGHLELPTCRYLADRYGTLAIDLVREAADDRRLLQPILPGRPEIVGQIDWAVRYEMALTVTDFMARRTQLFFRDADQGLGAIPTVAGRMAELLGWSDEQARHSANAYRDEVARSRQWRSQLSLTSAGA